MILVTGATGLVGSYLVHELLKLDRKVRAILHNQKSLNRTKQIFKSLGSNPEELISRIEWVEGDVLDVIALEKAMIGVEYVYHCAAIVSFDPREWNLMMKVNVEGTANVVNCSIEAGIKKLCHVSSIAALGRNDETGLIDETTEWRNSPYNSRYARSKYMAEREVWRASAEGVPVIIVNPSIILGYGHPDKGSTRMFKTIHKNSLFYGKGTNGYVDVKDVVKSMIELMDSDIINERFVVSGGNHTYKEIFTYIANGFNKPAPKIALPDFVLDLVWRFEKVRSIITKDKPLITKETAKTSRKSYYFSSRKLIDTLNFKFTPIGETINSVCKIMRKELD